MESTVRKTGRRICGCDRVGFVCGHGVCPCHACASDFYSVMTAVIFRNARTVQTSLRTRSMNGSATMSVERKNICRPGIM